MRLEEKKMMEKHILNSKESELKVAGCHVLLETIFAVEVAGLISSVVNKAV